MPDLVLVHGTFSRARSWHLAGSPFLAEAEARFTVWDFLWSGLLAGVPTELPGDPLEAANGADNGMLLPWLSEGEKLVLFLTVTGLLGKPDLRVLSHSHGVQVVAFACVKGANFKTAISISGPMRRDMLRARRIAMGRIGTWIQFADPTGTDRTIIEGELFDGSARHTAFDFPEGISVPTPGSGHSGLVNDAALRAQYNLWERLQ